jgi:hypothetical protein
MRIAALIVTGMWAAFIAAFFMLTGCATGGMKADVLGANIEIAKARTQAAAKPILDAEIPTPNGIMRIVVHAPQGAGNGQVAMPDDGWARVAERAVGVLGTAAGIYLGGDAAVGLVNAAGSGIVGALKSQQAPTVVMQPSPVVVAPAEPVIVQQPAPVIVQPAEPIIVPSPDPIIVEPVVIQ